VKTLELANKGYFLCVGQSPAEKAKLLRMVLSDRSVDALSVYPNYRKPFDLIFQRAKTEEWCATAFAHILLSSLHNKTSFSLFVPRRGCFFPAHSFGAVGCAGAGLYSGAGLAGVLNGLMSFFFGFFFSRPPLSRLPMYFLLSAWTHLKILSQRA
jgi:hypothetical protein